MAETNSGPNEKTDNLDISEDQENPLDFRSGEEEEASKEGGGEVIENIVTAETSEEEKLLDYIPEADTALLKDVTPEKSLLLIFLKILFALLIVSSLASLLFFTSQLKDYLDFATGPLNLPHVKNELIASNEEIKTLQTEYNYFRYIQANSYLNEFSYFGDTFVQNYEISQSQTTSADEKATAREAMTEVRNSIRETFLTINNKLYPNIDAPLIDIEMLDAEALKILFINALRDKIQAQINLIEQSKELESERDRKNLQQTRTIVGNERLLGIFKNTDFDALSDFELYSLTKSINTQIVNDMSIVQEIKSQRVKWSDVIDEIERRTIAVDNYYNQDFFNEIGGVRYSSYDFDTERRLISIAGEIKRFDTANFTMIANLMEEFNRSEMFEGAEIRSFSKSGSLESGYNSSISFSLTLIDSVINNQQE